MPLGKSSWEFWDPGLGAAAAVAHPPDSRHSRPLLLTRPGRPRRPSIKAIPRPTAHYMAFGNKTRRLTYAHLCTLSELINHPPCF